MADLVRLPDVAMVAIRRRGAGDLPAIGKSSMKDGDRIVAIGPDEWLVIGPNDDAPALMERWADAGGVQVDVSGNRVLYRMDGGGALDLLSAGCALDLETLGPGDAVSTLLARAQVIIVADGPGFLVLPRRSFGSLSGGVGACRLAALRR